MTKCVITGCTSTHPRYHLCPAHWWVVNPALQKTLLFLFNEGRSRPGYEDALLNAAAQVQAQLNGGLANAGARGPRGEQNSPRGRRGRP